MWHGLGANMKFSTTFSGVEPTQFQAHDQATSSLPSQEQAWPGELIVWKRLQVRHPGYRHRLLAHVQDEKKEPSQNLCNDSSPQVPSEVSHSTNFHQDERLKGGEKGKIFLYNISKRLRIVYGGLRQECEEGKRIVFPQVPIPISRERKTNWPLWKKCSPRTN